jgi:hypothetical protein
MSDEPFYLPHPARRPRRTAIPGEWLFDFTRASDGAAMTCELRHHGDLGWEVQLLEHGEISTARGGFGTRALAIQWADEARRILEAGLI